MSYVNAGRSARGIVPGHRHPTVPDAKPSPLRFRADGATRSARALSLRLFTSMLATQEMLTVYLGVKLGLYAALSDCQAVTPHVLAQKLGLDVRYVREWLEQQAVAGLLDIDSLEGERTFWLSPEYREVLTESASPLSMVSLTALPLGGVAMALPDLLAAFGSGSGVPDDCFGDDWRNGHSGANRALFTNSLPIWIRQRLPDIARRLEETPARVADVCCGAGWAGIAIAQSFPRATTEAFDIDLGTVKIARRNVEEGGVGDRVRVRNHDVREPLPGGPFDLIMVLDSLHEISDPAAILASARASCRLDGVVLLVEARVAEEFTAPGDEIERFQYATSVLHCLPAGRRDQDVFPTGTVLRPNAVREIVAEAGFDECVEIPFPDRFHRAYRLSP